MRAVALSPGLPPPSAPARGELHLRLVDLREAAGVERGLRCFLSRDEIERAARFQSEGARSRFVLTRAWLRVILSRCLDTPPERSSFSLGAHGNPALGEGFRHRALSFNVSHSEGSALIGLATGRAIGVDIEQVRPMPNFAEIASGYFSEAEMHAITALPEADRLRGFFRCWTRKEAFMKATGDGMAIALDALGDTYLRLAVEQGIDPSLMHRVATISSGTLDALPHNGTVLTVLQVSGLTHRESYVDMVMTVIVSVIIAFLAVILVGSMFRWF